MHLIFNVNRLKGNFPKCWRAKVGNISIFLLQQLLRNNMVTSSSTPAMGTHSMVGLWDVAELISIGKLDHWNTFRLRR